MASFADVGVQVRADLVAQGVLGFEQRELGLREGQLRGGQLPLRVYRCPVAKRPPVQLLLHEIQVGFGRVAGFLLHPHVLARGNHSPVGVLGGVDPVQHGSPAG